MPALSIIATKPASGAALDQVLIASRQFTRPFVYDKQNLQREQKKDIPAIPRQPAKTTTGRVAPAR